MYLAMRMENKIDYHKLKEEIIEQEGMVLHAYQDSLDKTTIGIGRLIQEPGGISEEEALYLMQNDINKIEVTLDEKWPVWRDLPLECQYVIYDLCFNLGCTGFLAFRRTRKYLEDGDFETAADELLDSRYHKQLPRRSMMNSERLRKCQEKPSSNNTPHKE